MLVRTAALAITLILEYVASLFHEPSNWARAFTQSLTTDRMISAIASMFIAGLFVAPFFVIEEALSGNILIQGAVAVLAADALCLLGLTVSGKLAAHKSLGVCFLFGVAGSVFFLLQPELALVKVRL